MRALFTLVGVALAAALVFQGMIWLSQGAELLFNYQAFVVWRQRTRRRPGD